MNAFPADSNASQSDTLAKRDARARSDRSYEYGCLFCGPRRCAV